MEYERYIKVEPSPGAELSGPSNNAIVREAALVWQAVDGFGNAAKSSVAPENLPGTGIKVGLNAGIAIGLSLAAKGHGIGSMAAKTFASSMAIAFGSDILVHAGEIGAALTDNLQSSDNWDHNAQVMRSHGGAFLFDTALMTATGLGAARVAHAYARRPVVELQSTPPGNTEHTPLASDFISGMDRPRLDFASLNRFTEPTSISTGSDAGRFTSIRGPQADPLQLEILRKTYPRLFEPQFAERVSTTVAAVMEQPIWQENLLPKFEKFGRISRFETHFTEKIAAGEGTPARIAALEKYAKQRTELSAELKGIIDNRVQSLNTALEPLFYNQQLPPFEFKAQFMVGEGAASAGSYTFEVNPLLLASRRHSAPLFSTMMHEYTHVNQNFLIARKAATELATPGGAAANAEQVAERVGTVTGKGPMLETDVFRSAVNLHSVAEPLTPTQMHIATRLADGYVQYPAVGRIGYLEHRGRQLQQAIDLLEENAGARAAENLTKALSTPDVWINIFNRQRGGTELSRALFERSVPGFVEDMRFNWLAAPKDSAGRIDLSRATGWDAEGNRQLLLQTFKAARDQVASSYTRASRSYYENILERQAHQATFLMPSPQPGSSAVSGLIQPSSTDGAPTIEQRRFWRGELEPQTKFKNQFWN